ncbi:DUF3460 family protein [Taylorella equigenitalis]|uniref:DUF3460 family protein n=1 Tax=Taylorella equigenitalis TaxID=29575 RepID=UPI000415AF03|nr:DUF3460 family protein [Taylorella equigenitalis]ASY37268.1 DUF3460 domain-containing protein [Taylorella equigenitalis]KGK33496.1 acetyl-CoA carboxylase carboxyl transferase subunit alpha [Taylorella equigenitalis]WDU46556.1 DUF3460 family protein [Taylorella equigenitalis]
MAKSFESETTLFLQQLKKDDPQLEARQKAGRARWWVCKTDPRQQEEFEEARIPQKPYQYYSIK